MITSKKVLLRERKRHTDRGVSSTTRGGIPPWPGPTGGTQGGVPLPWSGLMGGVPEVGYPLSGYPHPPARSDGGTQGGVPLWGTPSATSGGTQGGVPHGEVWYGYPRWGTPIRVPPARSNRGPGQTRVPEVGYPPLGYPLVRVPPAGVPPSWTWLGYPPPLAGPGRGIPLLGVDRQTDGWMDRHVSKHNLPSYYVRGR